MSVCGYNGCQLPNGAATELHVRTRQANTFIGWPPPILHHLRDPNSATRDNVIAGRIPSRNHLLAHCVTQAGALRLILLESNDLLTAFRLQIIMTDEAPIDGLVDPRGHAVCTFDLPILA